MKMILVVTLAAGLSTQSTQKPESSAKCPMHDAHAQMEERGVKGMGFSQTSTTHHFFIKPDGGTIEVSVKDVSDAANRDAIRMHLGHIAKAFQSGDFDIPMFADKEKVELLAVTDNSFVIANESDSVLFVFEQDPDGRTQIRAHNVGGSEEVIKRID